MAKSNIEGFILRNEVNELEPAENTTIV